MFHIAAALGFIVVQRLQVATKLRLSCDNTRSIIRDSHDSAATHWQRPQHGASSHERKGGALVLCILVVFDTVSLLFISAIRLFGARISLGFGVFTEPQFSPLVSSRDYAAWSSPWRSSPS